MAKTHIKSFQKILRDQYGYAIAVDGDFGPNTLGAATSALQLTREPSEDIRKEVAERDSNQFDPRTEKNLATLDVRALPTMRLLVGAAMEVAERNNVVVKVISGHRTWAQQDALYRKRPRVTRAKGGQSNHNFGVAIDFGVFSKSGKYLDGGTKAEKALAAKVHREIAAKAKAHGLITTEWGGDWKRFKDYPHHEIQTGLTMAQKRARYKKTGSVMIS